MALISGAVALASGLISGLLASKLMTYRIEQLEKNVEKHNNLVLYRRKNYTEHSKKGYAYGIAM